MAKYDKAASENVESTMRRRKKGTLKSGSGRKVTSRKQAIAIGLSEAREKGGDVDGVTGPAQLIGEREDARGPSECMVEQQHFSHVPLVSMSKARVDPGRRSSHADGGRRSRSDLIASLFHRSPP